MSKASSLNIGFLKMIHSINKHIAKSLSTVIATVVFVVAAVTTMHFTDTNADSLYDDTIFYVNKEQALSSTYKPNSRSSHSANNNSNTDLGFELIDNNFLSAATSVDSGTGQHVSSYIQNFNQPIYNKPQTKTAISSGQMSSSVIGMGAYALASNKQSSGISSQSLGTSMKFRSSSSTYVPFEEGGSKQSSNGWGEDWVIFFLTQEVSLQDPVCQWVMV